MLSIDLKEMKKELVTLNLKFAQIEGKLMGPEKISAQIQVDIIKVNHRLESNKEKTRNLEKEVTTQKQDLREVDEDLGELETLENWIILIGKIISG